MPGGARPGAGRKPDPNSARSERLGAFEVLPVEGYSGDVPEFPLPMATPREVELWEGFWRTPQAAAWAGQSWRWNELATFARLSVRVEDPECPGSIMSTWLRLRTDLGLSPAGLRENGWKIAAEKEQAARPTGKQRTAGGSRERLRVIEGAAG